MIRRIFKRSIKKVLGIDTRTADYDPNPQWTPPPAPTKMGPPPAPQPVPSVAAQADTVEDAPVEKAPAKKAAPEQAAAKKAAPEQAAAKKAAPKKAAAKKAAPRKAAAKKAAPIKAAAKKAEVPAPAPEAMSDTAGPPLNMVAVQEILDDMVRPALQGDGGDISLIKIEDNDIYVQLVGACNTCPSSIMTMKMGVEALLKEEFPAMNELIQVDPGLPH